MSNKKKYEYLSFSIQILKILRLWSSDENKKNYFCSDMMRYFFIISLLPTTIPLAFDLIMLTIELDSDLVQTIQVVLALACTLGTFYMSICFVRKRNEIKCLVDRIDSFKSYGSNVKYEEIDKRIQFYTKAFLIYSVLGIVTYATMPLLSLRYCEIHKSQNMKRLGIPCGLVARYRLPFKFDYFPMFELALAHQIYLVTCVTIVIITITMLLCGLLIFTIEQLKCVRSFVSSFPFRYNHNLHDHLFFCVRYHNDIIRYAKDINEAFGSQMLMHITLTSFVISVLGFEIIMVDNFMDSVRFTLHLLGWFGLLLLICYYGQRLNDESTGVARDIYFSPWYISPFAVQKDMLFILARGQKPLTLSALNFGVMTHQTFLKILSTSYTYFTLLVRLRK